jgi:hypothetical protein
LKSDESLLLAKNTEDVDLDLLGELGDLHEHAFEGDDDDAGEHASWQLLEERAHPQQHAHHQQRTHRRRQTRLATCLRARTHTLHSVRFLHTYTYIPLTLYPRRGSRGISDIPPRRPRFTKIT